MLMQFRNFTLNCYHVDRVGSNYAPRILSCKRFDVAMDATHQEKEILTSEGGMKQKRKNIIYVEVKWLRDRAARLSSTYN